MEFLYPEIRDQDFTDMELDLTEANVKTHSLLMETKVKCRKLRPDDCCKYCAMHCNDLTQIRQHEIELWRKDVNRAGRVRSAASKILVGRKPEADPFPYWNYSPPGRPDTTPGFRRIPTPKDWGSKPSTANKKRSAKREKTAQKIDLMITKATGDPLFVKRDRTEMVKDQGVKNNEDSKSDCSSDIGSEKAVVNADSDLEMDVCSIHSDSEDPVKPPHKVPSPRGNGGLRSIIAKSSAKSKETSRKESDDCKSPKNTTPAQNKTKPASGVRFSAGAPEIITMTSDEIHSTLPSLPTTPDQGTDENEYYELISEPNEAVVRALDGIIQCRSVTHNRAKRGLYKYERSCHPVLQDNNESRRFRRLNNNLHRHMQDNYLANVQMCNTIKNFYKKHQNSVPEDAGKIRLATPEMQRERRQGRMMSLSASGTQTTSFSNPTAHDSFLEILMDMDDKTA